MSLVPASASDCKSGQLEIKCAESSSMPVLLRTNVLSVDDESESLSMGSSPAKSCDRKDGMPAKFNFCAPR